MADSKLLGWLAPNPFFYSVEATANSCRCCCYGPYLLSLSAIPHSPLFSLAWLSQNTAKKGRLKNKKNEEHATFFLHKTWRNRTRGSILKNLCTTVSLDGRTDRRTDRLLGKQRELWPWIRKKGERERESFWPAWGGREGKSELNSSAPK